MLLERCKQCGKSAVWIILGINLCLFLIKGAFALLSNSRSLLADSFESLANFIITIIVIVSLRIADRQHSERHPYGYGKIEFLASGAVNLLLLLAAVAFVFISFKDMLMHGQEKPPEFMAITAAVISIIANQIAYLYGKCVGEKLRSPIIMANAWVNKIDVATSLAVIIAVIGTNMGIGFLDHLVAIVIAILIVKTTAEGMGKAIKGLMDYSSKDELKRIKKVVLGVSGILGIKRLGARQIGRKTWVDIEVLISNKRKLKDGLEIMRKLRQTLSEKIRNIADVSIQLVPADSAGSSVDKPENPGMKSERDK